MYWPQVWLSGVDIVANFCDRRCCDVGKWNSRKPEETGTNAGTGMGSRNRLCNRLLTTVRIIIWPTRQITRLFSTVERSLCLKLEELLRLGEFT